MFGSISLIELSISQAILRLLEPMLWDFVQVVRSLWIVGMLSLLALPQTCFLAYSRYSCPARRMTRSSTGLGLGCNKCLVWENMIADPPSSLHQARALSPAPIHRSPHLRWKVLSQPLMHWRERAVSANDAPRSRSSRPAHAGSFAEDVVLRDLVENLLLSIFEGEIPVDRPADVSLEPPEMMRKECTLPSAQSII